MDKSEVVKNCSLVSRRRLIERKQILTCDTGKQLSGKALNVGAGEGHIVIRF